MADTSRMARRVTDHRGLALLAASQDGLFTSRQAEEFGISRSLLSHHVKAGRYERIDRGLFLVPEIPGSPWRNVVAAWLKAGADEAVVSHETALVMHDLSDLVVDKVHITVPRSRRSRRHPPGTVVHTRVTPFEPDEVQTRNFVRVTAPAMAILDCFDADVGLEQISMAIEQSIDRGWLSPSELRALATKRGRRTERLVGELLAEAEGSR